MSREDAKIVKLNARRQKEYNRANEGPGIEEETQRIKRGHNKSKEECTHIKGNSYYQKETHKTHAFKNAILTLLKVKYKLRLLPIFSNLSSRENAGKLGILKPVVTSGRRVEYTQYSWIRIVQARAQEEF